MTLAELRRSRETTPEVAERTQRPGFGMSWARSCVSDVKS